MAGKLILVPTPIDDVSPLEPVAKSLLEQAVDNGDVILVEEMKAGRRRWLRFGLPREAIEDFILYNEHTRSEATVEEIMSKLKAGKNVFLMSDCGLPAFCDPGLKLVNRCHETKIRVSATPFANSIALAVALSGYDHHRFIFEGFIPAKKDERTQALKRILKQKETSIIMDTPYRLNKLIDEMIELGSNRQFCLALDLNQDSEEILRGTPSSIKKRLKNFKREFIMVLEPLS